MTKLLLALLALIATPALAAAPATFAPPAWASNAAIYEVNVRQFSAKGDFAGVERQLPRLRAMGVKVLWIMPIQPIGVKDRKGTLGSYYAIRDYTGINPEYGSMADFQRLVRKAHSLGMKVILDWVANHTAWDHPWLAQHPDWYKTDDKGKIISVRFGDAPNYEYWTDVVALDYTKPGMPEAMIDAMRFWVRDAGIDGFRCDVAGLVPVDFWVRARTELQRDKPLFMLAESDEPRMHAAFDMTYDWKLLDRLVAIAGGKEHADDLRAYVRDGQKGFPPSAIRMNFTSNHDVNSWRWSDRETYGARFQALAAIAAVLPGMPLVYSGQESGLDKKLAFFERDPIAWKTYANAAFYRRLLTLRQRNPALALTATQAPAMLLDAGAPDLFAVQRSRNGHSVTLVANLSDKPLTTRRLADVPAQTLAPWTFALGQR